PPVHLFRRRHIDSEALGPRVAIVVVARAPALRARAVSGGEGDGFVVEVQERVVMRLPLLVPPAPEIERAGDPEVARVKADDLPAGMKNAAVARPRTPERDRFDLAHRRDTVARRCHVSPYQPAGRPRGVRRSAMSAKFGKAAIAAQRWSP